MDNIRLAENITALRKEKKVTQEQLAEFCGVTKASVSKWETGQTMPDILLLPRLAAFFGTSIDELMGYEMQLTTEQIQKIQEELLEDFAVKGFDAAFQNCREYIKRYYSCYELLQKIILLWLSHEFLAGEQRMALLKETKELCEHILEHSRNISLCNDVIFLLAIVNFLLGHADLTVEALEDMSNPCRLSVQNEDVLLSAYIKLGDWEKGNDFAQFSMYLHVLMLVVDATKFLELHREDLEKCEETRKRVEAVMRLYNFEKINFHFSSLFVYQMAEVYSYHGKIEKAVEQLEKYVELQEAYLTGRIAYLQGDDYLDRLYIWYEKSVLSGNFPRDKRTVYMGMMQVLSSPSFEKLKEEETYITLCKKAKAVEDFLAETDFAAGRMEGDKRN